MAGIHKLTKSGKTIYPATVTNAVVHPELRTSLTSLINEYNVSNLYPTGGTDGSNKYTLNTAILLLDSKLNTEEKKIGTKIGFINQESNYVQYIFTGTTFTDTTNWEKFDSNSISNLNKNVGLDEYETFSEAKKYPAGYTLLKDGLLYTFITDHAAGAWNPDEVEDGSLKKEVENKITNLSKKETLRYIDGIFNGAESVSTEEKGLINKNGNHDNDFGYYFNITNDGGQYNNDIIFVKCSLYYLFDENWTNVVLRDKEGIIVYNTPIRVIDDIILIIPPKYSIEVTCQKNSIEKVVNADFNSKYIGFSDLISLWRKANEKLNDLDALSASVQILESDNDKNKNDINTINEQLVKESSNKIENTNLVSGLINASDGSVNTSLGGIYAHCVFDVSEYEEYYIKNTDTRVSNDNFALIAYYQDDNYLKSFTLLYSQNNNSQQIDKRITIPSGCNKIKIAVTTTTYTTALEVTKIVKESVIGYLVENVDKNTTSIAESNKKYEFEISNLKRRCKNLEDKDPFDFKDFDGCYLSIVIDDGNSYLKGIYDLFKELEIPLCAAVPSSAMDKTYDGNKILDVCKNIVEDGGEILCHNSSGSIYYNDDIEPDSSFEDYYNAFVVQKQDLESMGFSPRGIIRHNYSTQNNPIANDWLQMYYDYSDSWGKSDDKRYNRPRTFLSSYSSMDDLKTYIDTISAQNGWYPFCGHGTETLSTPESIREWITYAKEKGCKIVTFSELFDTFGTSLIRKHLGI